MEKQIFENLTCHGTKWVIETIANCKIPRGYPLFCSAPNLPTPTASGLPQPRRRLACIWPPEVNKWSNTCRLSRRKCGSRTHMKTVGLFVKIGSSIMKGLGCNRDVTSTKKRMSFSVGKLLSAHLAVISGPHALSGIFWVLRMTCH